MLSEQRCGKAMFAKRSVNHKALFPINSLWHVSPVLFRDIGVFAPELSGAPFDCFKSFRVLLRGNHNMTSGCDYSGFLSPYLSTSFPKNSGMLDAYWNEHRHIFCIKHVGG